MTIASMVRKMRAPVKILSGKVEELMFKYLLPVRAIRAMWTRSRAGSIRPKVGRPVAKALAIRGLLMKTTAGVAVGEQHLEEKSFRAITKYFISDRLELVTKELSIVFWLLTSGKN
jgi:hypothetical protein